MEPSGTLEHSLRAAAGCDSWSGLVAAAVLAARSLGAEGVSLGVLHPGDSGCVTQFAAGFDSELATRYARLSSQDPLPGPAALRTREPVLLPDRALTLEQYPAVRPILDASPYEAAACLPLVDDTGRALGYLAAHYLSAHRFEDREIALLRCFAAACAGAVLRLQRSVGEEVERLREQVEGLTTSMQTRGVIEQAKGMLMQRYDLSSESAWEVLRRLSSHSNLKVRDVAALIVTGDPVSGLTGRFIGDTDLARIGQKARADTSALG